MQPTSEHLGLLPIIGNALGPLASRVVNSLSLCLVRVQRTSMRTCLGQMTPEPLASERRTCLQDLGARGFRAFGKTRPLFGGSIADTTISTSWQRSEWPNTLEQYRNPTGSLPLTSGWFGALAGMCPILPTRTSSTPNPKQSKPT